MGVLGQGVVAADNIVASLWKGYTVCVELDLSVLLPQ